MPRGDGAIPDGLVDLLARIQKKRLQKTVEWSSFY